MSTRPVVVAAIAALVAGCVRQDRKPPEVARPAYLAGVPVIAYSTLQDTTGTADYQHAVMVAPVSMDSAASFYRHALAAGGWTRIADHGDTALATQYWKKGATSLWVQIRPGKGLCQVTLIGAAGGKAPAGDTAEILPPRPR